MESARRCPFRKFASECGVDHSEPDWNSLRVWTKGAIMLLTRDIIGLGLRRFAASPDVFLNLLL